MGHAIWPGESAAVTQLLVLTLLMLSTLKRALADLPTGGSGGACCGLAVRAIPGTGSMLKFVEFGETEDGVNALPVMPVSLVKTEIRRLSGLVGTIGTTRGRDTGACCIGWTGEGDGRSR